MLSWPLAPGPWSIYNRTNEGRYRNTARRCKRNAMNKKRKTGVAWSPVTGDWSLVTGHVERIDLCVSPSTGLFNINNKIARGSGQTQLNMNSSYSRQESIITLLPAFNN